MAHSYFRVCFHHNKQYKKANIVNNIAVISSDSYQTKTWWRAEIAEQLFWVTEVSFRTKQPLWILFIAQFTLSYLKLCMRYLINITLKIALFRSLTLPFVSKLRRRNIFRKWPTLNTDMTSRRNHYVTHENRLTPMHSISWTNGWILTKLAQTHCWEGQRSE